MDGRKRVFIYWEAGRRGGCKVLWYSGLRRCSLLDGVFLVVWQVDVSLGAGSTGGALSKKWVSPSTYRLGMWPGAIWNVPCGYMEGSI